MIQAVIFDMDGVLIDSEPIWQESEIAVFSRIGLHLRPSDCLKTTGLRTDEMVDFWYRRHPWSDPSKQEITREIIDTVIADIRRKGEPLPGFEQMLASVASLGCKTALASSSCYDIIRTVIEKLGLTGRFDVVYSAEEEPLGKPHPGVYLTTARKLGVDAAACVAIEDSINGVIAAKAARMTCIAIPVPEVRNDRRFGIADAIIHSLADIDQTWWRGLMRRNE